MRYHLLKLTLAAACGWLALLAPASAQPAPTLNLMPVPAQWQTAPGTLRLDRSFSIGFAAPATPRLYAGATRLLRRLDGRAQLFFTEGMPATGVKPGATLRIEVGRVGALTSGEDESYTLRVDDAGIVLRAPASKRCCN
jgi:hexosaminidase